jgi:hypothetical protein
MRLSVRPVMRVVTGASGPLGVRPPVPVLPRVPKFPRPAPISFAALACEAE